MTVATLVAEEPEPEALRTGSLARFVPPPAIPMRDPKTSLSLGRVRARSFVGTLADMGK